MKFHSLWMLSTVFVAFGFIAHRHTQQTRLTTSSPSSSSRTQCCLADAQNVKVCRISQFIMQRSYSVEYITYIYLSYSLSSILEPYLLLSTFFHRSIYCCISVWLCFISLSSFDFFARNTSDSSWAHRNTGVVNSVILIKYEQTFPTINIYSISTFCFDLHALSTICHPPFVISLAFQIHKHWQELKTPR